MLQGEIATLKGNNKILEALRMRLNPAHSLRLKIMVTKRKRTVVVNRTITMTLNNPSQRSLINNLNDRFEKNAVSIRDGYTITSVQVINKKV